jgi:hypothetical protein
MRPLAHLSGVVGALLDGGVRACCLSLLPADRETEVVCGCLAGSLRSPRGVLLDRGSTCLTFLVCGVVAYRLCIARNMSNSKARARISKMIQTSYLGGEVGVELLKRALKVVRVAMVVDVGVYVQDRVDVVRRGNFLHEGRRVVEDAI